MSGLPTGTVTLLLTDIEGSSRLWEQHPAEMAVALARHDELLRTTIESARGYVFKTVGDAFCAAFTAARDAVEAAMAAQHALHTERWPEKVSLRVRMALHTGECEERDGDYFGSAVNRAARLEAMANGGQVVVSRTTAEVLGTRLANGAELVNLGMHELRDLERSEEVYQLVIPGLPNSRGPLRTPGGAILAVGRASTPTNLTRPVSSFVGRDEEMAQITSLLGSSRLVTLVGSGGVGKTRLAIEVGLAVVDDTPDGTWLVELAMVNDSALVASEVLDDLGIAEQKGLGALQSLIEVLSTQSRLVILDNCEQVLEGCAAVADAVLRGCPDVRILATSREPLSMNGEMIYRVPSLSLPPEDAETRSDLEGSGAVALFTERARAQVPSFMLTDEDAALVASICRRLDGMPLALELATARLRSMSLSSLHERLEHRFALLTGGSRGALQRQQTLGALVDWSYDLLSEPERAVFRRTSVFVDGFTLEAAEGICALQDIDESQIVDLLASLVDKSLVVAEPSGSDLRNRLQETLQQYAAERLAEAPQAADSAGEADRTADAHADYYLGLAEQASTHLRGSSVRIWRERLRADDLNLRAAAEHALTGAGGPRRVLNQFWLAQRYWPEARQPGQTLALLELALHRLAAGIDAGDHARALYCKAALLHQIDRRLQLDAISDALGFSEQAGDDALRADVLSIYSRCLAGNGRGDEAVDAGARAVELARRIDDPRLLGSVLLQYATVLLLTGEDGLEAEAVFLEALALVKRTGDQWIAERLHDNYALVLLERGDISGARHHMERSLELQTGKVGQHGRELNPSLILTYGNLGLVLLLEGDAEDAESLLVDVLRSCRLNGALWQLTYTELALASCAAKLGDLHRAAVLYGGAEHLLSEVSGIWEPLESRIRAQDVALLQARLGDEFDRLFDKGYGMPHDEIVKLALSRTAPSEMTGRSA